MAEWHDPVAAFAAAHKYRFMGDLAFCRIYAPFGPTEVVLWVSSMGSGSARGTLFGTLS